MACLAFHGRGLHCNLVVGVRYLYPSTTITSYLDSEPSCFEGSIQTMCERGQLDKALAALSHLDQLGTVPSCGMYMSLLKACNKRKSLIHVKQVHTHLVRHRLELTSSLRDYLVITLAKCGALDYAHDVFHKLPRRNAFTWTAMISGFTESGRGWEALNMHRCMREECIEPNECTFVSLLKACGSIPDLEQGKKLHADARSKGYTSNVYVKSTLISMYGKCGSIMDAENVFAGLSECNVVPWNAMLSAYFEQDQGEKVLQLYRQMHEEGVTPDEWTFMTALQACGILAEKEEAIAAEGQSIKLVSLKIGQALHSDASRKGFALHVFVGNTLVSMYGKCGAIMEAEIVFGSLLQRNVVSWNAMLSACLENGQGEKALQLYRQMQVENVSPNKLSLAMALQACGILGEKEEGMVMEGKSAKMWSWKIGQALHADARRTGDASDIFVGSAVVSMYGKCGTIVEAESVFVGLSQHDVVSWNVMLSACVEQDEGEKALQLYRCMQKECFGPNITTLLCLLQACKQTGNMESCRQLHFTSISNGCDMNPLLETTLIHAYGSCASMVDAEAVFHVVPQPNVAAWSACIAGYAREGSFVACLQLFEEMHFAGITPNNVTYLSLLYACNHAGLVDKGANYFECMRTDVGITPDLKHYACMMDILGRAGDFNKVENMLGTMPMQADLSFWLGMLGACRIHGNVELGKHAFDVAVRLQPKESAAYILMSSIYSDTGLHDSAKEVKNSMQKEGAWIE